MNNIEDVKQRIVDTLGDRVKSVDFINATITNRPWFFSGVSKVIEGDSVDEVDINVINGVLSVNGNVPPDSKLIPHDTSKLFIYIPTIEENEISAENLIENITSSINEHEVISEKRPLDITLSILNSVKRSATSDEFIRIFISELIKAGELTLASKKLSDSIIEIITLININHNDNKYSVRNYVEHGLIVLEFYEEEQKLMYSSFPLNHKGFFGFANILYMLSSYNNFNIDKNL